MKPSHRHELKTNELAEWFSNLPQWFGANYKYIIGLMIILCVSLAGYLYISNIKNVIRPKNEADFTTSLNNINEIKYQIANTQNSGMDYSYFLNDLSDNFDNFSSISHKTNMAAQALIKEAELLRTELHYRKDEPSREELESQVNQAKSLYTLAIQKTSDNPLLLAAAKYGIGLCEEEIGNFEQAKTIYTEILDNSDFSGTIARSQAEFRLKTMSDYQNDIVFRPQPVAEANVPEETLLLNPMDSNSPLDINLPFDINVPTETTVIPPIEINLPSVEEVNSIVESINIPDSNEVNVPIE